MLFVTGERNRVFTDSNIACYNELRRLGCDWHELKVFSGYGHQDAFMGKNVARDIFPTFIGFLDRMGDRGAGAAPSMRAIREVPAA